MQKRLVNYDKETHFPRQNNGLIAEGEEEMEQDMLALWNLIKITPEKWSQVSYPDSGKEFWVVGLAGKTAVILMTWRKGSIFPVSKTMDTSMTGDTSTMNFNGR